MKKMFVLLIPLFILTACPTDTGSPASADKKVEKVKESAESDAKTDKK